MWVGPLGEFLWSAFVKTTINFCQSHNYSCAEVWKKNIAQKLKKLIDKTVLMCRKVKKIRWVINHMDHIMEIQPGKILISSHQFMSSSALFVPFQHKNILHFINTRLSDWKVFFEILTNDCVSRFTITRSKHLGIPTKHFRVHFWVIE